MRLVHHLAFRLTATLFFLLLVLLALSTYVFIDLQRRHYEESMAACARRASGFVQHALLDGMRSNSVEDIRETVRDMSDVPELALIRIVDTRGTIRYSSRPTEVGGTLELSSASCAGCPAPCLEACPQEAFVRGRYDRRRCRRQIEKDQENPYRIMDISSMTYAITCIKYCRACELACPVGG